MNEANFTENSYEQAIIALFQEMGYRHECGYDIERDYTNPLHVELLQRALKRINPQLSMHTIGEVVNALLRIEGANLVQQNERFNDYLQNGFPIEEKVAGEYRTLIAKLIDYDNPDNNDFCVVNQWTVEEYAKKRADIVVMVNGLPLVVMELKSPSNEGVGEDDAYNQLKAYQKLIPCLFVYNCFNVTSDMLTTRAGTITAKQSRYMEWKTVDGNRETVAVADYATFFRGIFQKERFLDLIQNFVCFDKGDGGSFKIMAAYHQYHAVNKALQRAKKAIEGDGKIGVFWHTQGSGKSLSMLFFTHLLIKHFAETTVVVVTDRKDLDQQLYGQFGRCQDYLRTQPEQANSRTQLVQLLKDRQSGGIIFTTIQKFEEADEPLSTRKNIIVISDEAHRSQYGAEEWDTTAQKMRKGMAQKMREALPNASFIGFTGTPIATRDKDTTEVFGDYIDIYDMTQAVDDGATRPVYYESRVIKLELNNEVMGELDKEFDELLNLGATDEQVHRTERDMSRLEKVLSNDTTIDSLVRDIVQHYEENRANHLTGKAMIVALTREVGIKIYKKMLELRPDWKEKVKVVMTASNKDPEEWHDIIGTDADKKELARKFKDNNDPMKIAIVRDMWLTGFDVPSLATMYVYKAMSGHNLMQAIARVNRVFPEKEGGLIIDYIGIAQALKQAMNDYTQRDQRRFGNPDIAKTALVKFYEELQLCREQLHRCNYEGFFADSNAQKAETLTAALNFILAPERENQRRRLDEHSKLLHNAQTLCRSLLSDHEKVEVAFFDALRVMMSRFVQGTGKKISKREINERISSLLQQSIKSEGVVNLFANTQMEFSLFDEKFMEEVRGMKEKNIALELLKSLLKEKVTELKRVNVVQSEAFSAMMTESLNRYIKGMISNQDVINELLAMAREIKAQEDEGEKLGLNVEEKAFYDALTKPQAVVDFYENDQLVALTRELTETIRKNRTIDWQHKTSARAQMRVMIKRLLKKYKYPPEGAEEALQIVMAQCENWADNEDNFVGAPAKLYDMQPSTYNGLMAAEE